MSYSVDPKNPAKPPGESFCQRVLREIHDAYDMETKPCYEVCRRKTSAVAGKQFEHCMAVCDAVKTFAAWHRKP